MAIQLAEKYSKKIVDKFYTDSVILGKTSNEYDWDGVESIKVWTISTYPPTNYARSQSYSAVSTNAVASRYGQTFEVEDTYQTMKLEQDKAVSLSVDKGNNTEQMLIKNAGVVMARELREQFIPMFDMHCLAKWSGQYGVSDTIPSWASLVQTQAETIGSSDSEATSDALRVRTIVHAISEGVTAIRNQGTDVNDAYCYIGESNFAKLLLSTEFLNIDKLGERNLERGVLGKVRGLQIVPIPDIYLMKSVSDVANNPGLNKDLNFMIVKKSCVLAPTKIKDAKVHQDPPGLSGALLEVRWLYDAFALDTKAKGIYVSTAEA